MKKITIISFLLSSVILFAQYTYVPDNSFEQKLINLGYDDVLDDYVLTANIDTVTTLDLSNIFIIDMTGIDGFAVLDELICPGTIATIDLSQNTLLTYLDCSSNHLTSLDLSQNTLLTDLRCSNNNLTTLDLSQNTLLTDLRCSNNNLTTLDLSQNTLLNRLSCRSNNLNTLDISQCIVLLRLWCSNNDLSTLDLSQNTALLILICDFNQFGTLDISQNTVLYGLSCDSNQLGTLDISQNGVLSLLWCAYNQLSSLDVSQNTALYWLDCSVNQLTNIDVSQNTLLKYLDCRDNQLSTLDLSQNVSLEELDCRDNQLTTLDVRSSNNSNISNSHFRASTNPNLTCIFVDDIVWSTANWTNIDPASTFIETQEQCDAIGVDEVLLSEDLQIYPNPTQNILNIKATNLTDKKYTIYNIYGGISKQGVLNDGQIDINALNASIYLLRINDMTTKIVKL